MKKYCELTNDKSACASLDDFAKELNSPRASVSYNLKIYNDNADDLENINLNQFYDLTNKDSFTKNFIEIINSIKIDRVNFDKIKKVELKAKL